MGVVHCGSVENSVRLVKYPGAGSEKVLLQISHYLTLDDNVVAELDRGERRLTVTFERTGGQNSMNAGVIHWKFRFYVEDPPPQRAVIAIADGRQIVLTFSPYRHKRTSETATLLDRGQRSEVNPALADSAQAQTGYITFGKPTAAGYAKREWSEYEAVAPLPQELWTALPQLQSLSWQVTAGKTIMQLPIEPGQIKALKRYRMNLIDRSEDADELSAAGSP